MKKLGLFAALLLLILMPLSMALVTTTAGVGDAVSKAVPCGQGVAASGSWRSPFTQSYRVSKRGFGMQLHPIFHQWRMHTGQDLVSQPGPGPIVSVGDGVVAFAGVKPFYGNEVLVRHAGGIDSMYGHLASIAVQTGQQVRAGTVLGVEGSTGASTGAHLHFEIHSGDKPIDPVPWMAQHGAPLNGKAVVATTAPALPALPAGTGGEGGIGFTLPAPGTPRQDSLHNPPLPIPAHVQALYRAAGARYKIPWTLLAGIGMEETGHGRNNRPSSVGAQGLMQFMPATFAQMGVDGDGDGRAVITSDADSVFTAANYLTKSGVGQGPTGVRKALFAYNHADWYVNDVLHYAGAYGGGVVPGDPSDCIDTGGQGNPNLPALTDARMRTVLAWASSHLGDAYVMGANGPRAWDCSSYVTGALATVGLTPPRTASAQRNWLAAGNGHRVPAGQERPGDLIFYDSYLGPNTIGHVAFVWDPATKKTIEAANPRQGVIHGSYATWQSQHIFEIWRIGNVADSTT